MQARETGLNRQHIGASQSRYQPEGDLSAFNTLSTAGTWTLQIEDDKKFNVGTLKSWSITVTHPTPGPNDPPVAVADTATTDEDTAVVIDVLANDTDPNGDPLSVTSVDALSTNLASISVAPDGSVTYDPTGSAAIQALPLGGILIDTFSYTIGDGKGGSSSATVTVTVNGLDEPAGVSVSGISPDNIPIDGKNIPVTITGSGFLANASVTFSNGAGPAPKISNIVVVSGTTITATVSAHKKAKASTWDVTVTNPDSSSATRVDGFTVGTPSATSAQSSGPAPSSALSSSDETSTETSINQPTDPTLLIVEPAPTEEEPDDESATDDDPEIIATTEEAEVDALFGDLDGSLQDDLLTV